MLMPTWPTSISLWNLRAAAPLWVNRPVPLPNGLALTRAMASIERIDFQHHQHRAEDFLGVDLHVGGHAREQGRADEVAFLVAGNRDVATIELKFRRLP